MKEMLMLVYFILSFGLVVSVCVCVSVCQEESDKYGKVECVCLLVTSHFHSVVL